MTTGAQERVGVTIMLKWEHPKWEHLYDGVKWVLIADDIDQAVAQAVQTERVEIAHRLRMILKDATPLYEITKCLALADELDPAALRARPPEPTAPEQEKEP